MSPESPHVHTGQAGSDAVRPRPIVPSPRKEPPWTKVCNDIWFADRNGGLGHCETHMLGILESYCWGKAYCWVSNAALARAYGGKKNAAGEVGTGATKKLLREMEAVGILLRVQPEAGRKGRVGILLFRRLNPDLPVADPEDPGPTIDLLKGTKQRRGGQQILPLSGPPSGQKSDPVEVKKVTPARGQKSDPRITSLTFEEDEVEVAPPNPRGELISLSTNDNDKTPDPGPAPQAPVVDPAEAIVEDLPTAPPTPRPFDLVADLAEGTRPEIRPVQAPRISGNSRLNLQPPREVAASTVPEFVPEPPKKPSGEARTPGQVSWLAGLTAEQRAAFDGLSPKVQARLLEPHRDRLNPCPILASEAGRVLGQIDRPGAAPLLSPMPADMVEAWEQLPRGPMHWIPGLVAGMVQGFGTAVDQRMRPAFTQLANDVQAGRLPAEDVVEPLRKALKPGVVNRGAIFNVELRPRLRARGYAWDWGSL